MAMACGLMVVGGCGAPEGSTAPFVDDTLSGEVNFWHSYVPGARSEALDEAIERFEERYPNVHINAETMTWGDFKKRWREGAQTGNLPDLSTACNMHEVEELYAAGLLRPADEAIDAIGRDRFSDNVLAELTHDGVAYGVPYYSHAFVMWYRQDLLDQAGLAVPQTWEEFAAAARALTDPEQGTYGYALAASPNDYMATVCLNLYLRSRGEGLLGHDLRANLTSEAALEGIRYWADVARDCAPPGSLDDTVNEQANRFYEGTTAFDFNSGFQVLGVQETRPDLLGSISCSLPPRMAASDGPYSTLVSHIPLVMYANGQNDEACEAFLAFLYEDENYLEFLDSVPVGMLPSIQGIASTEAYQSNPLRQQFAKEEGVIQEAMLEGHALGFEDAPNLHAGILTSSGVVERMFHRILEDGVAVEEAAQAAEDELNRLFDAAGTL